MNLAQLRYFQKLAQVQHFTKAAEELYITQPALSNSIKQLEAELGIPLFEHQGRSVRLTKWGREFSAYVGEGLNAIDKGVQVAQEHANNLSGTIDIGTIFTVQSDYLPSLLNSYRMRYGANVDVKLYQGLTRGLIENLESGMYDIAICAYVENKPGLCFIPVVTQDLVCVMHKDNPLLKKGDISLSDLQGHRVVTYRPNTALGGEVFQLLKDYDINIEQWCDDEITLGSVVAASPDFVGISLDTLGLAPFSQLKTVSIKEVPAGFHPVYLVYRKNTYKSRAVENMIELAREQQLEL